MNRITQEIRKTVEILHEQDANLADYHVEINHADMVQLKRDGWVVENNSVNVYGIQVRLDRSVQEPMLVHKDNDI